MERLVGEEEDEAAAPLQRTEQSQPLPRPPPRAPVTKIPHLPLPPLQTRKGSLPRREMGAVSQVDADVERDPVAEAGDRDQARQTRQRKPTIGLAGDLTPSGGEEGGEGDQKISVTVRDWGQKIGPNSVTEL